MAIQRPGTMLSQSVLGTITINFGLHASKEISNYDPKVRTPTQNQVHACVCRKATGVVGSTAVRALLIVSQRRAVVPEAGPPLLPFHGLRVINCLVFGSTGCGKSVLLHHLVNPEAGADISVDSSASNTAAALLNVSREGAGGGAGDEPPTALILIEVPEADALGIFTDPALTQERRSRLTSHHAAFFCFDCRSLRSLEMARSSLIAFSDITRNSIPVALIACKANLGMTPSVLDQVRTELATRQCIRGICVFICNTATTTWTPPT